MEHNELIGKIKDRIKTEGAIQATQRRQRDGKWFIRRVTITALLNYYHELRGSDYRHNCEKYIDEYWYRHRQLQKEYECAEE